MHCGPEFFFTFTRNRSLDSAVDCNLPVTVCLLFPNREIVTVPGSRRFGSAVGKCIRTGRVAKLAARCNVGVNGLPLELCCRPHIRLFRQCLFGIYRAWLEFNSVIREEF